MNPKKSFESGLPRLLLSTVCACLLIATPATGQITVINTGFMNNTSNLTIYSLSFDASKGGNAVDKLIVSAGTDPQSNVTHFL